LYLRDWSEKENIFLMVLSNQLIDGIPV